MLRSPGGADLKDEINAIGLRAKNVITLACDPPQKVVLFVDGREHGGRCLVLGQTPVTVEVVPGYGPSSILPNLLPLALLYIYHNAGGESVKGFLNLFLNRFSWRF